MSKNFHLVDQAGRFAILKEWALIVEGRASRSILKVKETEAISCFLSPIVVKSVAVVTEFVASCVEGGFYATAGGMITHDSPNLLIFHDVLVGGGRDGKGNLLPILCDSDEPRIVEWARGRKICYPIEYNLDMSSDQRALSEGPKQAIFHYTQVKKMNKPEFHSIVRGTAKDPDVVGICIVGEACYVGPAMTTRKKAEVEAAVFALFSLGIKGVQKRIVEPLVNYENYMGTLQEYSQRRGWRLPEYTIDARGMTHAPSFMVTVEVSKEFYRGGEFSTVKKAKQDAARVALEQLNSPDSVGAYRSRLLVFARHHFKVDPVFEVAEKVGASNECRWRMRIRLPDGMIMESDEWHLTKGAASEEAAKKMCCVLMGIASDKESTRRVIKGEAIRNDKTNTEWEFDAHIPQEFIGEFGSIVKGESSAGDLILELRSALSFHEGPISPRLFSREIGSYTLALEEHGNYHHHEGYEALSMLGDLSPIPFNKCKCCLVAVVSVPGWVTFRKVSVGRGKGESVLELFVKLLVAVDRLWVKDHPISLIENGEDIFFPDVVNEVDDALKFDSDDDVGDEIVYKGNSSKDDYDEV